jgi:hypothetical protein
MPAATRIHEFAVKGPNRRDPAAFQMIAEIRYIHEVPMDIMQVDNVWIETLKLIYQAPCSKWGKTIGKARHPRRERVEQHLSRGTDSDRPA